MSSHNFPSQEAWFNYDGPFNAERDRTLVEALVSHKSRGGWDGPVIPQDALQAATLTVNHLHGSSVTLANVIARMNFMELRYRTFKMVANFKGAKLDPSTNLVQAEEPIWNKIFKENVFAPAYLRNGEPLFHSLCYLYGANDVKKECSNSVVNVSSSFGSIHLADDDEVTSPNLWYSRRNLADDDEASSTNNFPMGNVDPRYVFIKPTSPTRMRPRGALPPRQVANSSKASGKKGSSSSCASSSPQDFVWGPFRR